jgi:hypothetical protein
MKNFSSIDQNLIRKLKQLGNWAVLVLAVIALAYRWDDWPKEWPVWETWQWISLIILSTSGLFVEVIMWWIPARMIKKLDFRAALMNTLRFQYFQLFAPSGMSEFGARYLQFKEKKLRKKSVEITALIQASKWISRIGLASMGLAFIRVMELPENLIRGLAILLFFIAVVFIQLINKPNLWTKRLSQKWINRFSKWLPHTSSGSFPIYKLVGLSLAKTITYTLAFAILLHPPLPVNHLIVWDNLMASWAFYFAAGFLPSLGIAEGLIKAGAGILFFTPWEIPEIRIAEAAFIIWICNKAIPGIIGGIFSLFNFYKKS